MQKRSCRRLNIPGTTLYYKEKKIFYFKMNDTKDYLPVINLSKGGAKFLCQQRLSPGKNINILLKIPGYDKIWPILAQIRWVCKNPEQSYQYQIGISFNSFGNKKNNNSLEILNFLDSIEKAYTKTID